MRGRVALYVAGGSTLLAFCGALAVLDAERENPDANITDFGQAIWWAATTMTTVGYGDHYPTTAEGRLGATVLMVGGIALLGTVTATLASWLVEQIKQPETSKLQAEVELLRLKIDQLLDTREERIKSGSEPARPFPSANPVIHAVGDRRTGGAMIG